MALSRPPPTRRLYPARRLSGVLAALLCVVRLGVAQEPAVPAVEGQNWPDGGSPPPEQIRFLVADDLLLFGDGSNDGRAAGFDADLAHELCAALGGRCTVEMRPGAELEAALLAGEGDAAVGGPAITPRSRGKLSFSRPYMPFPARFVMRRADAAAEPLWRALAGQPVGVVAGAAHERYLRENFPRLNPTLFSDTPAMLAALQAGRVEAAFGDGMRLSFWLAGGEGSACCAFAGGPYLDLPRFGGGLAIAVRGEDAALVRSLDRALDTLEENRKLAELYYRWFPVGFF
jgi:polar amino acid transport system substrate-binding protein